MKTVKMQKGGVIADFVDVEQARSEGWKVVPTETKVTEKVIEKPVKEFPSEKQIDEQKGKGKKVK